LTYDICVVPLDAFDETWAMFANLDIENMGFEEWIDEDAGLQDDGTYNWIGPFPCESENAIQSRKDSEDKGTQF
jgi:hypothetical protein